MLNLIPHVLPVSLRSIVSVLEDCTTATVGTESRLQANDLVSISHPCLATGRDPGGGSERAEFEADRSADPRDDAELVKIQDCTQGQGGLSPGRH